ncbi:MAG: hypothetical protein ORN23_03445 [Chthoniobacterales bacterium]|nr:hypothetical protein [Chthoniobacterales bacterium]
MQHSSSLDTSLYAAGNINPMIRFTALTLIMAMTMAVVPARVHACSSCPSGNTGTSYNFPDGVGGMAWMQYNFESQSQNYSGFNKAPADTNPDKLVQTSTMIAGLQYFWNEKWGFQVLVPSANTLYRYAPHNGDHAGETAEAHAEEAHAEEGHAEEAHAEEHQGEKVVTKQWWAMGDIRLNAIYTGLSKDQSTGINLGVKLPSGNWTEPNVERSVQVGTGSTDILFGFYHRHRITSDALWSWYSQAQLDAPVISQGGYTPGIAVDVATGVYYSGLSLGKLKIRPIGQAIFTTVGSDSGPNASGQNNGFQQLSLAPGIEFEVHPVRLYADVALPVMNNVSGNQLIAPAQVRVIASYSF